MQGDWLTQAVRSVGRGTLHSLLVCLAIYAPVVAQQPGGAPAPTPAPAPAQGASGASALQEPPCPPVTATPAVTDAYRVAGVEVDSGKPPLPTRRELKLRDFLAVRVANLPTLLAQQSCASKDGRQHKIALYLDQQPIEDLTPYPPTDPDSGVLMFRLSRSEVSREIWTSLLGKPGWKSRPTTVSVGLVDRFAIPSDASIQLAVLPHGWFLFWAVLFAVLLALFVTLARRSGLLRDDTPEPGGGHQRPYSLARTQAAWWFFLILASYLFIGMVTGDFSTSITGTVLVLLGVSAGTTVGAALIDASKATPEDQAKQEAALGRLNTKLTQVDQAIAAVDQQLAGNPNDAASAAAKADLVSEREALNSQVQKLKNHSEHFGRDLLSDADGVNFHRFQMVAWTLVLSIVFAVEVYREVAMPQFSETLLGLMGISAGTFLGLKIPEATVPKTTPTSAPGPATAVAVTTAHRHDPGA